MKDTERMGLAIHLLAAINRLGLKAYSCATKESLIFLMLNDTIQVTRYNRASLWSKDKDENDYKLVGISGHSAAKDDSLLVTQLKMVLNKISNKETTEIIAENASIKEGESENIYEGVVIHKNVHFAWLSIPTQMGHMGLLLERWNNIPWQFDEVELLNFLSQNYTAAWNKFASKEHFKKLFKNPYSKFALLTSMAVILSIRVPLRIVAPCEIVPDEPIFVTSPLEGIIKDVVVQPGQTVKKGDTLFEYDKRVPMEELSVAQKQVEVAEAEVMRANSQAFKNKKALSEYAILELKLKKEKVLLDLAKYKAGLLDVKAPEGGVVIIENPDEWRGNPVQIGTKVLKIGNPKKTLVKIWVPEEDNVDIKLGSEIKVILNVDPSNPEMATLNYVSPYTVMNDKSGLSFIAEARWKETPKNQHMGLKGTAILYGDKVSIFYWITRKPLNYIRMKLGF